MPYSLFRDPSASFAMTRRGLIASGMATALAPQIVAARPLENVASGLAEQLGTLERDNDFAGAVLLAKDDKILLRRAYGFAERSFAAPNRPDTKFNLASMGKMFTGLAIVGLAEAGQVRLHDSLLSHWPDYPNKTVAARISIHQILTHTSGLGNYLEGHERPGASRVHDLRDILPFFVDDPLTFEPGAQFGYSNAGYIVLGLLIERLSGEDYFDHVRRIIYTPLGMTDSDAYRADIAIPNIATGYMRALDAPGAWQSNVLTMGERGSSAGGSYSTLDDLFAFARALMAGRLLSPAGTKLYTEGKVDYYKGRYGYGMSEDVVGGRRIIGHSGGHYGIATELMMFPDSGYTAIILTNCDVDCYFEIATRIKAAIVGPTDATRSHFFTRDIVDATRAGGMTGGLALARATGEARKPSEILIDLAGLKALHRRENKAALDLLALNRLLFPESSGPLFSLASAYRVIGRATDAIASYRAYLAVEPDDKDAQRQLDRLLRESQATGETAPAASATK